MTGPSVQEVDAQGRAALDAIPHMTLLCMKHSYCGYAIQSLNQTRSIGHSNQALGAGIGRPRWSGSQPSLSS